MPIRPDWPDAQQKMAAGLQNMAVAKVEARPIDEALSNLEGSINELNQTISAFEKKLNPYLLPEAPSPTRGQDAPAPTRAAVTAKIHTSAYEISMAISYLHSLMQRMD